MFIFQFHHGTSSDIKLRIKKKKEKIDEVNFERKRKWIGPVAMRGAAHRHDGVAHP